MLAAVALAPNEDGTPGGQEILARTYRPEEGQVRTSPGVGVAEYGLTDVLATMLAPLATRYGSGDEEFMTERYLALDWLPDDTQHRTLLELSQRDER